MPEVKIICDLQFGSTGKGLIAGLIAEEWQPDAVAIAWMPNAGHTYIDKNGRKFVHTMLPNGVVSPLLKRIFIGPGAAINLDSLSSEIESCKDLLQGVNILIHPNAAIVSQSHRDLEAGPMNKIGSTKKGCGEALIQRIQRNPDNMNVAKFKLIGTDFEHMLVTEEGYSSELNSSNKILLEMAQGFSLSMYHGFYPYCTSRDCTPVQGLADTGIPFNWVKSVIGTLRAYPIRVANRYNAEHEMVGWSGPCYSDQVELKWEDIGQTPELTTVTKLERRIFSFSEKQFTHALRVCQPTDLFINFINYIPPHKRWEFFQNLRNIIKKEGMGTNLFYFGYGPTANDVSRSFNVNYPPAAYDGEV